MEDYDGNSAFQHVWNSGTSGKLFLYSVPKLRKLACKKKVKNYVLMKRDELITELEPIVEETDFPIK
jgi:hypothetical protein